MDQPEDRESEAAFLEKLGNVLIPPDTPEAPAENQQTEPVEGQEQPEEETAQAESDEGLVDLEMDDGEVVRVPEKYKQGYLRTSDYTRKTQDLAALQKTAQATLAQQGIINKFNEQTREDQQKLAQIKGELSRWKAVDMTNLDTESYIKNRAYIDNLKDEAKEIEQALAQKAQSVQQEYTHYRREASRHAYEYIAREVKEWQPDSSTEREVASYYGTRGIPPEVIVDLAVTYPAVAVALYKAKQYDSLQSNKSAIVKKVEKAPPVVRPGAATGNQTAQAVRFKNARSDLKKSGKVDDLAKLLLNSRII